MYKHYSAKFNTQHITGAILREKYEYDFIDSESVELMAKSLRGVHGVEVDAVEFSHSPGDFAVGGYREEDDSKMKELFWAIEQTGDFYEDDRENFDAVWDNQAYEPECAVHFEKEWFDILEPSHS